MASSTESSSSPSLRKNAGNELHAEIGTVPAAIAVIEGTENADHSDQQMIETAVGISDTSQGVHEDHHVEIQTIPPPGRSARSDRAAPATRGASGSKCGAVPAGPLQTRGVVPRSHPKHQICKKSEDKKHMPLLCPH